MTEPPDVSRAELRVDHLVYATPGLDAGIEAIRRRLGIDPRPGGRHPRWRTRNVLVGLGPTTYLEIIGPDEGPEGIEESDEVESPRPFGIDALTSPRLVSWAARATPLEPAVRSARHAGFDPGPVMAGRRETSDGTVLRWRLTDPTLPALAAPSGRGGGRSGAGPLRPDRRAGGYGDLRLGSLSTRYSGSRYERQATDVGGREKPSDLSDPARVSGVQW